MKYGFGVDLGGTTVKFAFFDQTGTLLHKWQIPTSKQNSGKQILPDIAASIHNFLQQHKQKPEDILGLGIGIPGPVRSDGTVEGCVNLGWGPTYVTKELSRLTGLPVKAGNDASLAALGECWAGGGAGFENIILITIGTGLGGGIVIGGKVVHGTHGAAGEIGHMTVNREETILCNCGRKGCAEQYCSATGIVRLAAAAGKPYLTCKDVFDAAEGGDPAARAVLQQVYGYLGELLANISCVTDPQAIILGGGVSKAGIPLLEGVREAYRLRCFDSFRDVAFRLATLGNDAGAYGAFRLISGG